MFTCSKFLDLLSSSCDSLEISLASARGRCFTQEMNLVECVCDFGGRLRMKVTVAYLVGESRMSGLSLRGLVPAGEGDPGG